MYSCDRQQPTSMRSHASGAIREISSGIFEIFSVNVFSYMIVTNILCQFQFIVLYSEPGSICSTEVRCLDKIVI